jgi:hypothetical protein
MNNRITIPLLILFVLVTLPLIGSPVCAEDTLKNILAKKYNAEKDICPVVKKSIMEGLGTKDVTKSCIEMGYDACLVVRCAVEAKGKLEEIIIGALEAGATSDVCSRCALDAGADPLEIAKALEQGLGYSTPLEAGLTTGEISLPGGSGSGGVISPSSF